MYEILNAVQLKETFWCYSHPRTFYLLCLFSAMAVLFFLSYVEKDLITSFARLFVLCLFRGTGVSFRNGTDKVYISPVLASYPISPGISFSRLENRPKGVPFRPVEYRRLPRGMRTKRNRIEMPRRHTRGGLHFSRITAADLPVFRVSSVAYRLFVFFSSRIGSIKAIEKGRNE